MTTQSEPKQFVVTGSFPNSVASFRGDLIRAIVSAGHSVTVMTADTTDEIRNEIENLGVEFQPYPIKRNTISVTSDLETLRALRTAYRGLQPDTVLAYTIKPIIWGGIAARTCRKTKFFALVTGLGYAFQGTTFKRRMLNWLVSRLYRFSLGRSAGVIFQNTDNRDIFVDRGIVPAHKCHVVNGSGINTARFQHCTLPDGPPRFLLIARLLGEKGIREYAAAAKIVKKTHPSAIFELLGPEDPSPDGIPISEIRKFEEEGTISYLGSSHDVRPYLQNCHIYVLPSYHEGMPRTVLEAMATGRPIITTDVPGCRETLEPGVNGWLVPKQDKKTLAETMIRAIDSRQKWQEIGNNSRRLAEEKFDVDKVNEQMLKIMGVAEQ